jgi:hypothetical protein
VSAFIRYRFTSIGLGVAIVSALVAMTAGGRALVSGPGRVQGSALVIVLPNSTALVFVIAAVVLLGLVIVRASWAKLAGAAVVFGLAGTEALMVTIGRTSTRFPADAATHLQRGGQLLAIAFVIAIAGLLVMIVGARELMPTDGSSEPGLDSAGLPVRPGGAVVALGFSVLGVIFFPVAPVGVMMGLVAYWQIVRAGDRVPGRNIAFTAILLGTTWISLWTILVFATGIWSAHGV